MTQAKRSGSATPYGTPIPTTGETGRFMRNLQRSGDLRTRKKDFVRMMIDNNVPSHAVDKVFGGGILYLEGHELFMQRRRKPQGCGGVVQGPGIPSGIRRENILLLLPAQRPRHRHVTKKCPYTGQNVFVFRTEKEVLVKKIVEQKKVVIMEMKQVNWSSGKVVKTMMGLGKFKHYTKVDFEPFGPTRNLRRP